MLNATIHNWDNFAKIAEDICSQTSEKAMQETIEIMYEGSIDVDERKDYPKSSIYCMKKRLNTLVTELFKVAGNE